MGPRFHGNDKCELSGIPTLVNPSSPVAAIKQTSVPIHGVLHFAI